MTAQPTVIARFLTLAAEITGDHTITVDVTTDDGWATAECTACSARSQTRDLHVRALPWAEKHSAACRAIPVTR
ncbi:hypothetical protein ACJBCE_09455 [Streptomyces sp. NBUL23]|uniref:hypothetical protein n=1 Tax=Streptomyces TaxID=1883 RepID=UPI0008055E32|nr:hypothetical protein [Streptomyces sp. MnatMP-M77]MYT78623.1 hypothetical protein [Streptomyces sp. SID8364]SBV06811.1 hypothetical protein YW3DRAFT_02816 [Streptomyces sp. MnatMP-M77]